MTGFNWKKAQDRHLTKLKYRLQRELSVNHPDKMLTMPEECKAQTSHAPLLKHCSELLDKKHQAYLRRVHTPTIIRPKRLSHG